MRQIEKLKLKKKFLTSAISLTTLLSITPIYKQNVYANEIDLDINYEQNNSCDDLNVVFDIFYYSSVYNLNRDIVLEIFKNKTYNFSDFGWTDYNMINYKMYENKDLAIIETIKDIKENPKNYGYEKSDIESDFIYEPVNTPEFMAEKYSNIYGIPFEIVLSIMYSECGKEMNSHNYLSNNNPAGIGPHMHFENKEIGIIYFINLLKSKYGCNENSTSEFFNLIARTYSENPEHWVKLTTSHYNDILNQKVLIK